MSETYDGIFLGAGHNTLVTQAYLARAGLSVIALEKRDVPGGGLTTIEHPPGAGFLHNTHAFYHRGLRDMPWYRDLELERHGARYLQPDLNVVLISKDGCPLEWWADFDKTVESFARFSEKDAANIRRWRDEFRPIVQQILEPEAQSPPLPQLQREELLSKSASGLFSANLSTRRCRLGCYSSTVCARSISGSRGSAITFQLCLPASAWPKWRLAVQNRLLMRW